MSMTRLEKRILERLDKNKLEALEKMNGTAPKASRRHVSAKTEWQARLAEKLEQGISRLQAVQQLGREYPNLRTEMVQQANAGRTTIQPEASYRSRRTNARDQWEELMQRLMDGGLSKEQAARKLVSERPGLREAVVEEANAGRR